MFLAEGQRRTGREASRFSCFFCPVFYLSCNLCVILHFFAYMLGVTTDVFVWRLATLVDMCWIRRLHDSAVFVKQSLGFALFCGCSKCFISTVSPPPPLKIMEEIDLLKKYWLVSRLRSFRIQRQNNKIFSGEVCILILQERMIFF
jgi:hypothetical protein